MCVCVHFCDAMALGGMHITHTSTSQQHQSTLKKSGRSKSSCACDVCEIQPALHFGTSLKKTRSSDPTLQVTSSPVLYARCSHGAGSKTHTCKPKYTLVVATFTLLFATSWQVPNCEVRYKPKTSSLKVLNTYKFVTSWQVPNCRVSSHLQVRHFMGSAEL